MKWIYHAQSVAGNFFAAAEYLSVFHPSWDVVAMTMSGNYTIVVYREEIL